MGNTALLKNRFGLSKLVKALKMHCYILNIAHHEKNPITPVENVMKLLS